MHLRGSLLAAVPGFNDVGRRAFGKFELAFERSTASGHWTIGGKPDADGAAGLAVVHRNSAPAILAGDEIVGQCAAVAAIVACRAQAIAIALAAPTTG